MFRRWYRNVNKIQLKSGRIDCFSRNLLLLNYNDNFNNCISCLQRFSYPRCSFFAFKIIYLWCTCIDGDIDGRFNRLSANRHYWDLLFVNEIWIIWSQLTLAEKKQADRVYQWNVIVPPNRNAHNFRKRALVIWKISDPGDRIELSKGSI